MLVSYRPEEDAGYLCLCVSCKKTNFTNKLLQATRIIQTVLLSTMTSGIDLPLYWCT